MTTYTKAVAEAKRLVKRSEADQWRLAELTWEQVEAGKTRTQWGRDIGVGQPYASELYQVWSAELSRTTGLRPYFWDAISALRQGVDDPQIARQVERDKLAQRTIRNASPEQRVETARELLANPEVAEQLADEIETKVAESPAAVIRVNQEAERRRPTPPRHTPERSALSAAASLTAFTAWVAEGEQVVSDVVADVMDGQADPGLLSGPNGNLAVLLARLRSAADTTKNFDTALADILNGND